MASADRTGDRGPLVVVVAFVLFAAVPFVSAVSRASFWQPHSPAPLATAAVAILLVALVTRRRWAWVLLLIFHGFAVASFAWDWTSTVAFGVNLITLGLLVSSPMRRYVGWRMPRGAPQAVGRASAERPPGRV